jgi:hypothetical protein
MPLFAEISFDPFPLDLPNIFTSPPARGGRGQGEGGAGPAFLGADVAIVPAPLTPTLSPRPAGGEGD